MPTRAKAKSTKHTALDCLENAKHKHHRIDNPVKSTKCIATRSKAKSTKFTALDCIEKAKNKHHRIDNPVKSTNHTATRPKTKTTKHKALDCIENKNISTVGLTTLPRAQRVQQQPDQRPRPQSV